MVLGFGRWAIFQGTGKIRECKSSYEKKPKLQGPEQQERGNQTEGSAKFLGGTNISLEAHDDQESSSDSSRDEKSDNGVWEAWGHGAGMGWARLGMWAGRVRGLGAEGPRRPHYRFCTFS